jgi:hypothetical protein
VLVLPCSIGYAVDLMRRGNPLGEWFRFLGNSVFVALILGIWLSAVVAAYRRLRTDRRGRLASCHACLHRWRL